MTDNQTPPRPFWQRPATAVRLILLAVLIAFLLPLPGVIAYANPGEAVVLGRYSARYAVLLGGYLAICLGWAALAGASFRWLDDRRISRLRRAAGRHLWAVGGGVGLLLAGLTAARLILLLDVVGTPTSFKGLVELLPTIVGVAVVALLIALVDDDLAAAAEQAAGRLDRRLPPAIRGVWQGLVRWRNPLLLALVPGVLFALLFVGNLWDYPLTLDPSVHVTLGQELLRGGVPYQTIVYFHPPFRFAISALWAAVAGIVQQPVPVAARAIDLLVAVGVMVGVYQVGREVTGRRAGGLLGVIILAACDMINELIIAGPTFRLTTGLLLVWGMWAGQKRRWFWAGLAGALAAGSYLPAGAVLVALVTAALLAEGDNRARWRSAGRVLLGASAAAGAGVAALAAYGAVGDAYRQSIGSVFSMLTDRSGGSGTPLVERLNWYRTVIGWQFRGDVELAVLLVIGPLVLIARRGLRSIGRTPSLHVPFVTALLLFLPLIRTYDASVRDTFLILLPLAPLGAAAVTELAGRLGRRYRGAPRFVQALLLGGALLWGLVVGLADMFDHNRYLYSRASMTFSQQQEVADSLSQTLSAGDRVQSFSNLWYQAASNTPNALPVLQMGARGRWANQAAGWTDTRILAALREAQPVVVFVVGGEELPGPFANWMAEEYDYLGRIDPAGDLFWQSVYLRADRLDLRPILERLPLE